MFTSINDLKDVNFDHLQQNSSEHEDSKFGVHNAFYEKFVHQHTAECHVENEEEFFMSRSIETKIRAYEISFEASFMKEHEIAFKNNLKNFMEQSFKFLDDRSSIDQFQNIFQIFAQASSSHKCQNKINFSQKTQFLKDLQGKEKLDQFYKFLEKNLSQNIYEQFLYLGSIFSQAIADQKKELSNFQIMEQCERFTEQKFQEIYKGKNINILSLKMVASQELNSDQICKAAFKSFLKVFFCTIMLVSHQYFQNPYMLAQRIKRPRLFQTQGISSGQESNQQSQYTEQYVFSVPRKKTH